MQRYNNLLSDNVSCNIFIFCYISTIQTFPVLKVKGYRTAVIRLYLLRNKAHFSANLMHKRQHIIQVTIRIYTIYHSDDSPPFDSASGIKAAISFRTK